MIIKTKPKDKNLTHDLNKNISNTHKYLTWIKIISRGQNKIRKWFMTR